MSDDKLTEQEKKIRANLDEARKVPHEQRARALFHEAQTLYLGFVGDLMAEANVLHSDEKIRVAAAAGMVAAAVSIIEAQGVDPVAFLSKLLSVEKARQARIEAVELPPAPDEKWN